MATGYGGSYRAVVVDNVDPLQQNRLGVVVPEIYGDASAWARAASTAVMPPSAGETVWVTFEHGDTDYPVWSLEEGGGGATRGFIGKYRGVVVDNNDPQQEQRVMVSVPEVDSSAAWAKAQDPYAALPDVGSEVWVEYDNGDPAYPRWTG
jgi:hypothetical protein